MDKHHYQIATPRIPDASIPREPWWCLTSNYVKRALDELPKQAAVAPWRLHQSYPRDLKLFSLGPVTDEMDFARGPAQKPTAAASS